MVRVINPLYQFCAKRLYFCFVFEGNRLRKSSLCTHCIVEQMFEYSCIPNYENFILLLGLFHDNDSSSIIFNEKYPYFFYFCSVNSNKTDFRDLIVTVNNVCTFNHNSKRGKGLLQLRCTSR